MPGREVYAFIAAIRQLLCGWYAWTVAFLEGTFGLLDALGGFFLWALDQICGPLSNIPGVGWIFRVICVAVRGAAEWVGGFPRDVIEWPFQRILDLFALFIWAVVYAGMGATWVFHQAFGRLEWFWFFSAQGNWKKQCIKIKVIVVNSPGTPGLVVEIASTGVATSFESKTREVLEQCGIPRDQVQFGWFGETNPENSEGVGFAMNFFPIIKNGPFLAILPRADRELMWFRVCKP